MFFEADAVAAQISQQRLQSRAINNARVPQPEMVESVQPIEQPPDSATPAENVQYQVATVPDRSQAEAAQGGNEVSSQEGRSLTAYNDCLILTNRQFVNMHVNHELIPNDKVSVGILGTDNYRSICMLSRL